MKHSDEPFTGPERRADTAVYLGHERKRKQTLTEADIEAIIEGFRGQALPHICRYDISVDDMRDLMAFVRTFRDASIETRKTFQTMVIRMLVWGFIAGVIGLLASRFGWFRALARYLTIPVP